MQGVIHPPRGKSASLRRRALRTISTASTSCFPRMMTPSGQWFWAVLCSCLVVIFYHRQEDIVQHCYGGSFSGRSLRMLTHSNLSIHAGNQVMLPFQDKEIMSTTRVNSINQSSIAPISPAKPGSVARQSYQCSTAKSRKHFRNININYQF